MSTFATPAETARRQAETEARTREAWREYHDGLRDLEGREYEDAESAAWDQLQATLDGLEADAPTP